MKFEAKKVEIIIRILMALELIRITQVVQAYFLANGKSMVFEQWLYAIFAAVSLMLVGLNIRRNITAVAALIIIYKFDFIFNCNSISTALFSFLCLFIAAYHSFIIELKGKDALLEVLYAFLWMAYGYINISSAWNHLEDPYWKNGYAMELFFTHPYYGTFFNYFRSIQHNYPEFSRLFFKGITYAVLSSQLLLIPLYFFKWGRIILRIWAGLLLITIGVFLKISLLPHFSLLLFILIFWRPEGTQISIKSILPRHIENLNLRRIAYGFYFVFIVSFSLHTPIVNKASEQLFWITREWETKNWLNKKFAMLGFHKPDVFNTNHVEGGQRWFVIYRIDGEHKRLVRFFDTRGARLSYSGFDPLWLNNHGSDYLYFGNTVQYVLGNDSLTYENSATPYRFSGNAVTRLIRYDYYRKGSSEPTHYSVDFYERPFKTKGGNPSWEIKAIKTGTRNYLMTKDTPNQLYPKIE